MNAYDKALSLLAMREHTAKEITRKLLEKGYERGDIESAVSRLETEGAISNKRYVESYLRSRARKGGESFCLMRKGYTLSEIKRAKQREY